MEPQEDIDKLAGMGHAEFKKHREWFAVDAVAFRRSRSGSALGRCGHVA
ncbi:MAG: hypothetical protein ACLUAM_08310 [Bifidobacterium adolescentis]